MKIKIIFFLFLIFGINGISQIVPSAYSLLGKNSLRKITNDDSPAGNGITDIITVGDTIIAGSGKGLSISTDGGASWKNFYGTKDFGTESISAIGYNNGVIWAATAHDETFSGSTVQVGSGLKISYDKGNTWKSIPQPVDTDKDTIVVYGRNKIHALPITVPQQNLTFDIAFTPGTVWITSWAGGLRKSTDGGSTWQRVVLPPDNLDHIAPSDTLNFCLSPVAGKICSQGNLNHSGFSVIAVNDSTLYVGTAGGINKSTDGGISWQKFNHQNQQNPIGGNFVVALAYNSATKTIWAGTNQANDPAEFSSVSSSTDGGNNWKTFLRGEFVHNFGFKSSDIIAATDDGAFRSSDNGTSWILPTSIIDESSKLQLQTNIFYTAASQGQIIWLGSADGLVKLNETGGMWQGTWKIFLASKALTSADDSYAFPNPFYPKIDGTVKIKYSTAGKSVPVTIRIFDFGMNYVRTIIQNIQKGSSSNANASEIDFWDGKDDSGKLVTNGVYFYRIDRGSAKPEFGKIIVIE